MFLPNLIYSQYRYYPAWPTHRFDGQIVCVTGSNVGLGKEAARHYVRLGAAKVILAVRNVKAGEAAKEDIEASQKRTGACEVWHLDLSDYSSVKSFAARLNTLPRLDILLENAGIATATFRQAGGHENTITVNVISTFLLALLALPKLKETRRKFPASRPHLTIVSSEVHELPVFAEQHAASVFGALSDEKTAVMTERYPTSKLLEVLVCRHIAPRIVDSGVILNFLNPGFCHSELTREAGFSFAIMKFFLARSTESGSRVLVAATVLGPSSHGKYINHGKVMEETLSEFVRSDEGYDAQEKVWKELEVILNGIEPGVTNQIHA